MDDFVENWWMYLSCPNDFYSRQKKSIFNHMKSPLITRNQFLRQKINSYNKKLILVTRNLCLSQETNSCHKKSILVTRNPLLWAHILRLNLSICDDAYILPKNSLELIHFVGTWFPGSQWICRPVQRFLTRYMGLNPICHGLLGPDRFPGGGQSARTLFNRLF